MSATELSKSLGKIVKKMKMDVKTLYDKFGGLADIIGNFSSDELMATLKMLAEKAALKKSDGNNIVQYKIFSHDDNCRCRR